MFAVLGNELAIAKWLFNQGVDINAQGSNGWSAVTIASAKGFAEMLAWLVAIGVNVNAADVYQFSPLMRAVDNGHANAVHILLGVPGIEIDVQDEAKNTALHYAVANNRRDLVELLLDSGARSDIRNRMGQTAATMARDEAALSALIPIQ
jgi:ankyrin repeat protein